MTVLATAAYDSSASTRSPGGAAENPLHTDTTRPPYSTPWEVRLGLTMLPVRYIFRSSTEALAKLVPKETLEALVEKGINAPAFEIAYDNILAAGSFSYTQHVQSSILKDIRNVYAEAVAFEKNKDPAAITREDIAASDNIIVRATMQNYHRKEWKRYGISALPLLRNVPAMNTLKLGDLAVGAWGALWAYDVWGRQPTMLETFVNFINDKLNPRYGIADRIKPADILNMYQQYAYRFAPDQAFRSVAMNDEDANRMWALNEPVFARIAELMNNSYNYKHAVSIDEAGHLQGRTDHFGLPKFIYLLGHGLINSRKPDWSMAYVEIANDYGMEAVKEMARAEKAGVTLDEVLQKYPLERPLPSQTFTAQTGHSAPILHNSAESAPEAQITTDHATLEGKIAQPIPMLAASH